MVNEYPHYVASTCEDGDSVSQLKLLPLLYSDAQQKTSSAPEKFRVVGGQIVPYVEIPLDPRDIDHIVQGPESYREASGAAISRFASSHGFNGVTVKPSQVPIG